MNLVRFFGCTFLLAAWQLGWGCSSSQQSQGAGSLVGTIFGPTQVGLADAVVRIGSLQTTSQLDGTFSFGSIPARRVTIEVGGLNWLKGVQTEIEIKAQVENQHDVQLTAWPLLLLAQDQILANQFLAQQTDWTLQSITVGIAKRPNKAEIERILYHNNPALMRSPADNFTLVPDPAPVMSGESATGFEFVLPEKIGELDCDQVGQNAIDRDSIQNEMPPEVSAAADDQHFMWTGMELELMRWDFMVARNVYCVGQTVRTQVWSSPSPLESTPPQSLQATVLVGNDVWVEVAFEKWVILSDSISDSNADGKKEVFAKVVDGAFHDQVVSYLREEYARNMQDAYALGLHLENLLSDFYGWTNPRLTTTIGTPFLWPGMGELQYPFAVMSHDGGRVQNVFLVAPSP